MFLIVGLGNPGKEYDGTRHNIGFAAIDYIADKYNIELNRVKFKGVFGEGFIDNNHFDHADYGAEILFKGFACIPK